MKFLDALIDAAKRVELMPARKQHAMAKTSALHTVCDLGSASVADVVQRQGLVEIRAKLALEQLVTDGILMRRQDGRYQLRRAP